MKFILNTSILLSAILLAGCSDLAVLQPKPDVSRFFYLQLSDSPDETEAVLEDPAIAIGPSSLARHLDQPRMVTYREDNEIVYADYERWAEPLDDNLRRLLVAILNQVPEIPRAGLQRQVGPSAEYTVPFQVIRFGTTQDGNAILQVSWSVNSSGPSSPVAAERTFQRPAEGEDVASRVQALQEVVLDWAGSVADQIRELEAAGED
jgi:uncharacterized lipoprotein YmbA